MFNYCDPKQSQQQQQQHSSSNRRSLSVSAPVIPVLEEESDRSMGEAALDVFGGFPSYHCMTPCDYGMDIALSEGDERFEKWGGDGGGGAIWEDPIPFVA